MKKILNKWQFLFCFKKNQLTRKGYKFIFGLFKLHAFPEEGEAIQKKHYKGLIINL